MISIGMVIYKDGKFINGLLDNISPYTDDIVIIEQRDFKRDDFMAEKMLWWQKNHPGVAISHHITTPKGYGDPDRTTLLALGRYDWMLMIDADERIPAGIPFDEIVSKGYDAVNLPMRSLYFEPGSGFEGMSYEQLLTKGKEVNEGYPDWHPRLLKKGTEWPADVHNRPQFRRIFNAEGYDMLHLKTYEAQLAKNKKYAEMFPEWAARLDGHCRYVQQQLGLPIVGLQ